MGRIIIILVALQQLFCVAIGGPPLQNSEDIRGVSSLFEKVGASASRGGKALLPITLRPTHYDVVLRPILYPDDSGTEYTAPGSVKINVIAENASNYVVLHKSSRLTVNNETIVISSGDAKEEIASIEIDDGQATLLVRVANNFTVGKDYVISMDFTAPISASLEGLYRAQYEDPEEGTRRMATTQFEAYGARQAFPCFDEPRFKTNYTFTLGRPSNLPRYTTIANGALKEAGVPHDSLPGWVWDTYETTVAMPSYLVAVVISDFEYVNATEGLYNKPVRIFAQRSQIQRNGAQLAADVSARTLRFLEEKFDHPYEMPKMDSIAVPSDYFAAGAMENWGLVTYKDNYLMYFVNETTETNRQLTQSVIAHEFAHQWFGNLVTCKYWSHIWLNEGFATYVANLVVQQELKEYQDEIEMLWGSVQYSMAWDVGKDNPILNLNDPLESFSSPSIIIYDKAGSIIRMMEGFLGSETLIAGLQKYLKRHAYQAAEQDDLWAALNEQAQQDGKLPEDKTIKQVMDTWTTQSGFPLLRVSKITESRIHISQERFLPLGTTMDTQATLWEIPIAISTKSSGFAGHSPVLWMGKDTLLTSHAIDAGSWIVVNPDAYGYYRVLYDEELSALIKNELATNRAAISALSRSQIIDDYFALVTNGHIPISRALDMTIGLENEKDFVVWYALFTALQRTLSIFRHVDLPAMKGYLAPSLEATLNSISWDQDPAEHGTVVMFRAKAVDWACALESTACENKAKELLQSWQLQPSDNPIGFDLQPSLYCAIVGNGGEEAFDFIFSKFSTETDAIQKDRLLQSLTCVRDDTLINRMIDLAVNQPERVNNKTQVILQGIAATSAGRSHVFDAIRNNATFEILLEKTGSVYAFLNTVSTLSNYITQEMDLEALMEFTSTRVELSPPALQNNLQASFNNIKNNVAWVAKYYEEISEFFKNNVPSVPKN